ncbi:MAG TPA: TRAP transporter substrate-binding protein [Tepidimicrobium sp.]|nr:TRAP transporter substrate-binding protein [Tepidimicrobium sp.]
MKKSFRVLSLMLAILLIALVGVGCAGNDAGDSNDKEDATQTGEGSGEKIVWKLGHLGNEDHIWNKTALKFAELVDEKTDGQLEIKVYPNEQLGNEIDTINMVQAGTADMVISGESMQNWAPKTALMAVPYAFKSTEHMVKAIEGEVGEEISAEIEKKVGLIPLYYHARAPRNLTSNEPISKPEDLKGFKMRVPNVPLFLDAWKEAGANPQAMAFNEVFTAIQQAVIDGQENPVDLIHSAGFYEIQKYVNETEHVHGWVYVLVGKKQFEALSEELKAAVLEAAAEAQIFGDELFEEEITGYIEDLKAKGMTFHPVDKEAFRAAMEPAVMAKLTDDQKALLEKISELE